MPDRSDASFFGSERVEKTGDGRDHDHFGNKTGQSSNGAEECPRSGTRPTNHREKSRESWCWTGHAEWEGDGMGRAGRKVRQRNGLYEGQPRQQDDARTPASQKQVDLMGPRDSPGENEPPWLARIFSPWPMSRAALKTPQDSKRHLLVDPVRWISGLTYQPKGSS